MEEILVTGGAGYIGSHTCVALIEAGYRPVVFDSLANSSRTALERVARITGTHPPFHQGDVRNTGALHAVLRSHQISAAIHFAGLKAVGESVRYPLQYYSNNVAGTVTLLQALNDHGVRKFIFSSSATVYGNCSTLPIRETAPVLPTNPYGYSKAVVERVLQDLAAAEPCWGIGSLRYFNPAGAHGSGLIGEDPRGTPNNLMPYVAQVAVGRRPYLRVYGSDYPTPDGTGVRDYVHVMDLADGHVAALRRVLDEEGMFTVNLGTGRGHSVREVLRAFERASGRPVAHRFFDRRPGDVAASYADAALASSLLGWRSSRTLYDMCADTWRWQQQNPCGYHSPSTGIDRAVV